MRELLTLWRDTRMVVLVAQIAALYAAVCIPFKVAIIIPGITEVRPGAVIPVVCGVLFGPAAAWGSAFGNLIADFFGTLGPGSIPGFIANFLYGYVSYRLWRLLAPGRPEFRASGRGWRLLASSLVGGALAAVVVYCAIYFTNAQGEPLLRRYAFWITTGTLIVVNLWVLLITRRAQEPENLEEVMDRSVGVMPALCRNATIGVALSAIPLFVFWVSPPAAELTFALCEFVVLLDALLLAAPLQAALSQRRETRLAVSTLSRLTLTALVSSAVCAFVVGFGVEAVGVAPFQIVAPIVLINNFVLTCLLAPVLLGVLYPRVARWGLLADDVLPPESREEGIAPAVGLIVVAGVTVLGLVAGCWLGVEPGQAAMSLSSLGIGVAPQVPLWKATLPFFLLLLCGVGLL